MLTSLFLDENLKVRVKQVEQTAEFLETEIARLKNDLEEIEKALALFKQQHQNELPAMISMNQQMVFETERKVEMLTEQIRSLKDREASIREQLAGVKPSLTKDDQRRQLEELRIQMSDLAARYSDQHPDVIHLKSQIKDREAYIREQLVGGKPSVADDALRRQLEELRTKTSDLSARYSDQHPDVIRLRSQVAELENKLKAGGTGGESQAADNPAYITLRAQLVSTQIDIDSLQRQIVGLQDNVRELRRRISAAPIIEQEYNDLMGKRTSTLSKYNDLTMKLMEAKVATGLEKEQKGERFTLIDPPRLPEKPIKPNRLGILMIGLVLGIGAGVGLAALREFTDDSVHTAEQLEASTRFPVLAGIPVIETPKDLRRKKARRIAYALSTAGVLVASVLVIHFFVMDLDVFWARLVRKMPL